MENETPTPRVGMVALKNALSTDSVSQRFKDMLGQKSAGFLSSISSVVSNNALLQKADVNSIILASSQAAALDLPINPNLGYAALIPYENKKEKTCTAQFQIQRNGWVELCMRTNQVSRIVNEVVYEGQLVSRNKFTDEYVFDEDAKISDKVIGYMAYVKLVNGFEKTVYWTVEECKAHGMKYSKTFKNGYGLWVDNFDSMSLKTVLKHLIVKYVPKSIQLYNAITSDQASFSGDLNSPKINYIDNDKSEPTDWQEAEVVDSESEESK